MPNLTIVDPCDSVFNGSGTLPMIRRIALPDEFLAAGALPTLHDRYGLSAPAIVSAVKGWL